MVTDVVSLLVLVTKLLDDLDRRYLRSTASELGLTELLDRCMGEAGLEG